MKNVEMTIDEKGILTIKIDTTKRFGLSGSGKSEIVATTAGNVPVPDSDVKIGINAYVKA